MSAVKLSVLMTTFNRRRALERTLPALLAQEFPPADCEIVVVVDGSTDGTLGFLSHLNGPFRVKVISQPNRGLAAARNAGLAAAEGDVVLFLDDDIICTPGVLRQHCAAHAGPGPLLVHGPIHVAHDSLRTLIRYATEVWYESYYGRLDPAVGIRLPRDIYFLGNSSIPRETLLACGGLDEQAPGVDDFELGLRLWKRGVRFQYLPAAAAYELFVKSTQEFLQKQVKKWAKAEIYLCRKHPEYRPHSKLAGTGKPPGWKECLRNMVMRSPVSPLPLFTLPLWMTERLYSFVPIRKAGIRMLDAAARITLLRTAFREAGSWEALQHEFGMKLPVLLYHHVGPPQRDTNPALTVLPERFEAQVRWLARRGYVGIRPSDWLAWYRTGKPLPEKPVLVTFDDAYADIAEYALPVLERHGFGGAVFVITGRVGGTIAWGQAKGSFRLMTADQIRYWANREIEFGAHSRSHPDLTTLDPPDLAEEVVGSKNDLEGILQSPVVSFAYPYGHYNPAVCECVRRVYDLAFSVDEGLNDLRTDPHLLRRTLVSPGDSMVDLASRVRRGFSRLQRIRGRIRLRARLKGATRAILARSH